MGKGTAENNAAYKCSGSKDREILKGSLEEVGPRLLPEGLQMARGLFQPHHHPPRCPLLSPPTHRLCAPTLVASAHAVPPTWNGPSWLPSLQSQFVLILQQSQLLPPGSFPDHSHAKAPDGCSPSTFPLPGTSRRLQAYLCVTEPVLMENAGLLDGPPGPVAEG